jgi:hypothetical protein
MTNSGRKTVGHLHLNSLVGASFFTGNIKNSLLGTITEVFKDKNSGEVTIGVNYPSTGSYNRCPLEECKRYPLATMKEVERHTKGHEGYSE